jgi:hypothetical protein
MPCNSADLTEHVTSRFELVDRVSFLCTPPVQVCGLSIDSQCTCFPLISLVLLNISVSEVCIGLSFSATAIYACKWLTVYFCGAEIEDVDSNSGLSSQQSA